MAKSVWVIRNQEYIPAYWSMTHGWVDTAFDIFSKRVAVLINFPVGGIWERYRRPLDAVQRQSIIDVDAYRKPKLAYPFKSAGTTASGKQRKRKSGKRKQIKLWFIEKRGESDVYWRVLDKATRTKAGWVSYHKRTMFVSPRSLSLAKMPPDGIWHSTKSPWNQEELIERRNKKVIVK